LNSYDGSAIRRTLPLSTTLPLAIVFGLGLILTGVWLTVLAPTVMFVSRAHDAQGIYLGSDARVGGLHGGTFLHPAFRFVTPNGKVVDFVTRSGATNQPYADGQKVRVLYDPARPGDARLDTFFEIWAGPVFVMPFALLPLLIPVYIFFAARRRR
jgi:hypothetical protein